MPVSFQERKPVSLQERKADSVPGRRAHRTRGTRRWVISAVSSVLYTNEAATYELTKSGKYVYWGDATKYHEWECRTRLSVLSTGDDYYQDTVTKIVERVARRRFCCRPRSWLG